MSIVGEAFVIIRPESSGFSAALLKDVEKASNAAGKKASSAFSDGWVKAGVVVVAALAAATVSAVKYQKTLTLLQTQAGASRQEVARMGTALLSLAPQVGQGPEKLAEAMYHIESVGYRGAQALDVLKVSAEGAKISGANLDDTTYALTSTLQTGIGGIHNATDAMAALNAIVGTGDMRMQDLNGAISTGFLATAETFGVDIRSIGAALAYMTDRGSGAQESATRLRMSLALMAAPSAKASTMLTAIGLGGAEVTARTGAMTEALQKAGLTTTQLSDDLRKPDGIQVALSDLVMHLKDSGLSADAASALISRAFGGGRSGAAIMSLVQHLDILKKKFDDQGRLANNFGAAWAATTETTSFKFSQLTALVEADGIRLGNALLPAVTALGSGLFHFLSDAPHLFEPIGSGLADVGHSLMDVQHNLEPIESLMGNAFGGVVLLAVHGIAAGLQVIAAALHIVSDLANFFDHNSVAAGALATVIAIALLPRLIVLAQTLTTLALDKLALGLFNAAGAAGALTSKLAGMNPWVLATTLAIGAGVAIYEHYTHAKQAAAVATNDLVTAMQKEAAGSQNSILTELSKQLNDLHVGDDIRRLGLDINDVSQAVLSGGTQFDTLSAEVDRFFHPHVGDNSNDLLSQIRATTAAIRQTGDASPALDKLINQFYSLTNNSSLTGKQLEANKKDVLNVLSAMAELGGSLNSADSAYSSLVLNMRLANSALVAAQKPTSSLTQAQTDAATAAKALAAANGVINLSVSTSTTALAKQVDLLKDYSTQAQVTGTQIQATLNANISMLAHEGDNVNRLAGRLAPDFIQHLVTEGPQYVAAAAGLGDQALTALNQSWLQGQTQLAHTGAAIGRALVPAAVQSATDALTAQKTAIQRASDLTFAATVQSSILAAASIAGNGGTATGDQFSDRVLAKKNTVLTAMLDALPAPVRTATLQALGIVTDAGGRLPANLAAAIAAHQPLAVMAAQNLQLAVQSKIDALHGKTVSVEAQDNASAALNTINGDITQLEGLNNTLKAMRYAGGGIVPGNDGATADNHLALLSSGEAVVPVHAVPAVAPILAHYGVPGFAKGGLVDGGSFDIWPVLTHGYVQSLADGLSSNPLLSGASGVSGNVQSWLPVVLQALALNGASAIWAPRVLSQIEFESGGNANAHQQVIDINTFNGSGGAQGLLQVLLGTFLSNHVPGTSMNIFDPLANVAAGVHHAIHDDPGGLSYLGQGHGYDNGGPLMPGWTAAYNGTGKPENVRTHQADDQMLDALKAIQSEIRNARPVTVENTYVGVDPALAQRDANRELAHALRGL